MDANVAAPGIDRAELRFWAVTLVVYSLSFGLSLLYPGIYWDDWVLIELAPRLVYDDFVLTGRPGFGIIHWLPLALPAPVWIYKGAIFASNAANAWIFDRIVASTKAVSDRDRWATTMLFAVFPVFAARHSIVLLQYSICMGAFLIACRMWQALLDPAGRPAPIRWSIRIVVLVLLFFSYSLEVHLVLTCIALPWLALLQPTPEPRLPAKTRLRGLLRYPDLLTAPIVFWVGSKLLFPKQGFYAGVNTFHLADLLWSPLWVLQSFSRAYLEPLAEGLSTPLGIAGWVALLFCCIQLTRQSTANAQASGQRDARYAWMLISGVTLFAAAVFPFAAVGKPPWQEDWASRGQALLPIGISLMTVGWIRILCRPRYQTSIYAAVIAVALGANMKVEVEYLKDWLKQDSLLLNLEELSGLEPIHTLLVNDKTPELNARQRTYRYFEYTGMLHHVYGDQTRLAIPKADYSGHASIRKMLRPRHPIYKMLEYTPGRPEAELHIGYGRIDLRSDREALRLLWLSLSDPQRYRAELRDSLTVDLQPRRSASR